MGRPPRIKGDVMKRKVSPFTGKDTLKIYIKRYTPEDLYKRDKEDKAKFIPYTEERRRERGDYTKVFKSAESRLRKARLSPRAAHLLHWIMEKTVNGEDWVTIKYKEYVKECSRVTKDGKSINLSRNTYKEVIDELIDSAFISATSLNETFFINPNLYFNGSRPKRFPGNIEYID